LSEETLLEQGLDLMLYGMGTVFVFLTLLVIVTALMSAAIQRWLPDDEIEVASPAGNNFGVDDRITTIIQLALDKHRCRRQ